MTGLTFVLAPSLEIARAWNPHITVEAEYGSEVVEGTVFTAAHHQKQGPYSKYESPSPCNNSKIPAMLQGVVLCSHWDLDTLGGCLRAAQGTEDLFYGIRDSFWDLAERVDLAGAHKLGTFGAKTEDVERLYAFWAWSRAYIPRFKRDASTDITEWVAAGGTALRMIFRGDESLLTAGRVMRNEEQTLNIKTFDKKRVCGIISRRSEGEFCNHLYVCPDGEPRVAVVAYDTKGGSITISLADPIEGVSCREVVQTLWGPEAGGHDGIAGSPRGRMMTEAEFQAAVGLLADRIGDKAGPTSDWK